VLIHGRQIGDLEESDLQTLIDDQVAEGKNIEYKRELPQKTDSDKKEFLADISSFANSAGGYVFYGVSEKDGLPVAIDGLGGIDPDAEISRFENLLRDGLAPRISGIRFFSISLTDGGCVIAAYIPKSWASPHMIKYKGTSRFFARNSSGKYQLDVFELRTAFNASNIEGEQLKNFKIDRLGKIIANETPVPMEEKAKVVLHLIPVSSLTSGIKYNLHEFQISPNKQKLAPISLDYGSNLRFNFDGLVTFKEHGQSELSYTYLQLFRNGIVESVSTIYFLHELTPPKVDIHPLEKELIEALERFFMIQSFLETEPPYFLIFTLLGVRGFSIPTKGSSSRHDNIIDKNDLLVPEILIEDISIPASTILKPAFDTIWNAAGLSQSPNYDTDGNRKPK
jgi:hypothetical protein